VEFVLEADALDERDMVCDFKVVKETMCEFLETFDHALCVNTADPKFGELRAAYGDRIIAFEQVDPTTEIIAQTVHAHFKKKLVEYRAHSRKYPVRDAVRIVKVRVWETSSSWAEYAEDQRDA
jgi:6-pyruvoyltetrahydropterin/6-carboxytetrahydropterin synthase